MVQLYVHTCPAPCNSGAGHQSNLIGFVILVWDLLTVGRREVRVVLPLQTA